MASRLQRGLAFLVLCVALALCADGEQMARLERSVVDLRARLQLLQSDQQNLPELDRQLEQLTSIKQHQLDDLLVSGHTDGNQSSAHRARLDELNLQFEDQAAEMKVKHQQHMNDVATRLHEAAVRAGNQHQEAKDRLQARCSAEKAALTEQHERSLKAAVNKLQGAKEELWHAKHDARHHRRANAEAERAAFEKANPSHKASESPIKGTTPETRRTDDDMPFMDQNESATPTDAPVQTLQVHIANYTEEERLAYEKNMNDIDEGIVECDGNRHTCSPVPIN